MPATRRAYGEFSTMARWRKGSTMPPTAVTSSVSESPSSTEIAVNQVVNA